MVSLPVVLNLPLFSCTYVFISPACLCFSLHDRQFNVPAGWLVSSLQNINNIHQTAFASGIFVGFYSAAAASEPTLWQHNCVWLILIVSFVPCKQANIPTIIISARMLPQRFLNAWLHALELVRPSLLLRTDEHKMNMQECACKRLCANSL